jgi:S1-C subfamily serine protease
LLLGIAPTGHAAELRVWTSDSGDFSTVAELVRVEDDAVILRKPSGVQVRVPLSRLSYEDRRFAYGGDAAIEAAGPSSSSEPPASVATTAASVEAEASRSPTALDAAMACEFHLAAGKLAPAERAKVEQRLVYWRSLAKQGRVRLGRDWVTPHEAENARKAAREKIDLAIELLRLQNGKLAEQTLLEASELDPSSGEADFVRGIIHGAIVGNDREAAKSFAECVRRDAADVAALNNLAVSEFFCRKYDSAIDHWLQAVRLSPEPPALSQNLASLLAAASSRGVRASRTKVEAASEAYARLLTKHNHSRPDQLRFVYMPLRRFASKVQRDSQGDLIAVSSGTGFVVSPGVLITNEHVVEEADGVLIVDPEDSSRRLPAEVVAVDASLDVALVKCSDLRAEPMPLCGDLPGRGADVMVLGYPLGVELGLQLKVTRGSVVAMPAPESDDLLLVDAITNPGNSGGPLCDEGGRVVGVVRALFRGEGGGAYGAAIPMARVLRFLQAHGVTPTIDNSPAESIGWSEVDRRRAPATVLVLNRQRIVRTDTFGREF